MVIPRIIGVILTAVVLILYLVGNQFLDIMELKTYDMRMRAQGTRVPAGNVVIAAIDDKSLAELGRWPWSRRTTANLIEKLDSLGARVIAIDLFFPESENRELLDQIERLETQHGFNEGTSPYESIKRTLAADLRLSEAIAQSGKIVLSMVFVMSEEEAWQRPETESEATFADIKDQAIQVVRHSGDGRLDFPMPEPAGLLADLPALRANAKYTGHINMVRDRDGGQRWASLVMRYKGHFFPSADVQAVLAYRILVDELVLHTSDYGITGLSIGSRFINTDKHGRALINYHGPKQTISTVSVWDIYNENVKPDLKDKIVLIGAIATGIGDISVTPYGLTYPGVEIRANTIQNLIDGDFINRPYLIVDALVIIVLGSLLSWILPQFGMWRGAVLALALFGVYTVTAVILFRSQLIWLNIVYPSVLIVALFACVRNR